MEESLRDAREELKRADHLIYVSLKYTRTCDIFKSIIQRLVDAIDFMIVGLLKGLEEQGRVQEVPEQPGVKVSLLRSTLKGDKYQKLIEITDLYLLLRKMNRATFTRAREFRRHVTMTMEIEGEKHEINIDKITEFYKKTKEYIEYVESIAKEDLGMK